MAQKTNNWASTFVNLCMVLTRCGSSVHTTGILDGGWLALDSSMMPPMMDFTNPNPMAIGCGMTQQKNTIHQWHIPEMMPTFTIGTKTTLNGCCGQNNQVNTFVITN